MAVKEKYKQLVHKLARYGCFSIGLVYLMVGVIALLSLLGVKDGGADEDSILNFLMGIPMGPVLIWGIIGGLIGYIVWRVFEAITDPYEFGSHLKGIGQRTGIALSGFGYGVIAYSAITYLLGTGNGGDGEREQQLMVSEVLQWPAGSWLVGAAGLVVAFTAFVQFKFVIDGDHNPRLAIEHLSAAKKKWIHILAWAGYFARGIILLVLAYFILKAAITSNPFEIGNTDTAFDFIGKGIIGHTLFVLVGLGTIAYGLFMFVFGYFYSFRKGKTGPYTQQP
ncbi:hypothetical protein D770_09355 [Flammeovirgaceae bacterium 311]|nr:hypothetical protein D770_09355 [Flammeovirgaceae bacterium 311]